ncbi:DUF4145 domain-containing protein [Paenibacillus sp. FSL H8-0332]|uniref:DUF4145 domain-containing protein n=1 Tax=Paenibacillus sp. FSL H8-0332 TaxID=2954742 RepID=UPI0030CC0C96
MNYCNQCGHLANYTILLQEDKEGDFSNDPDYRCKYIYMIVKCSGCGNISYRSEYHDIERADYDEELYSRYGVEELAVPVTVTTYPTKSIKINKIISEVSYSIPESIYLTYQQTLIAFQNEAKILVGIGFRAIIEAICADQLVEGSNLQQSIENLHIKGVLAKREKDFLHAIRFLGNDAAHKIKEPTDKQLSITLTVIEQLLINLYVLPHNMKEEMETVVDNYEEFERILNDQLLNFSQAEELPLKEYLGINTRRLFHNFAQKEMELKNKIHSGNYTKLKIGKMDFYNNSKAEVQHYILD